MKTVFAWRRAWLKLPAKAGEAWRVDALDLRYTTGEEEVVEVPAGRFKAVRVELRRVMDGDVVYHNTDWYAPGVGVVKAISRDREGDRVTVLKAFIPAAKK